MLNSDFRYIGLDFETTGLDPAKDEPIQIGIVEMDISWNTINEYTSLLKPTKDLNELKSIVGFITGLSVEALSQAPSPQDIVTNIEHFFWSKTVLIWHNIAFDIQFLEKFFPSCTYYSTIDTFPLAQTLFHYQPSYALEVLVPWENAHDALQDTKNALILFNKIAEKIENISTKYPILRTFTANQNFCLSAYLANNPTITTPIIKDIPKLNKILPPNTQIQPNQNTLDTNTLENQKRYYVGNINIKTFIERLSPNKNSIIAFSNLQKLDIAKNILNDMGLKNLWFLKDEQLIDYDIFEKFLNKSSFSNDEIKFIIKYYSQLDQGLGILDLNNKYDYQIYHAIKNTKSKTKYPIVLTTHQWLFNYLQDGESEYQDYDIFFLDAEWRYKSYNLFLSRPVDMYYTLTLIENLLYKSNLESQINQWVIASESVAIQSDNHLQHFYTSFQIFIGQLFMESKGLFVNTQVENIQVNPISTNSTFYKTNLLRTQIRENYSQLQSDLQEQDFALLEKHILHIDNLFNTILTIQKKMNNSDIYFVYSEHTQFTSRPEFIDIFSSNIYFFSNSDKKAIELFPNEAPKSIIPTIQIWLYDRILAYIQKYQSPTTFFILSTRKEESKQLFDTFYKNNLHEKYMILVENITGGMGKNLFKAKTTQPKIIIWWYAFLLSVYASKIPLDEIIIFNIRGGNEQSILDDIQRYGVK